MLTGRLTQGEIAKHDFRATLPRFQGDAFEHNRSIVQRVEEVAQRVGASPGQVALAWLLAKSPNVIPIPGTKHKKYLEENARAAAVHLSNDDIALLNALPAPMGDRYAPANTTKP